MSWQTGLKSEPAQEGVDRLFLVNRGWINGRVTKIDATTVGFDMGGQTQTFQRAEVSLMQLTDWLSPEKRQDKQEVKVRIVCEGEAEAATILFTRGTIISKVDGQPKFTAGQDTDDKAGTDRTSVWFEKGGNDRSVTSLSADVTLLIPAIDLLECEVLCNRANGFAGSFNIRFLNPTDGKELVALKKPIKEFWSRFEVPLAKLKASLQPYKVDCVSCNEVIVPNVRTLPPQPSPSSPKDTTEARIFLLDYQLVTGRMLSMDEYSVRLKSGLGQPVLIPRWKIACIELNDWEASFREGKAGMPTKELTASLLISFSGPSAVCELTFPSTAEAVAKLIVPPHFVSGWDRDDIGFVKSERAFGFEKTVIDRSPSQVEATVVLKVPSGPGMEIGVSNAYTNGWAGDLKVNIYEALTKKTVETSNPATQKNLKSTLKISRGKLNGQ